MAAVWNIGTQVVEYKLSPQQLGEEAKELSETDAKLMKELNSIHQKLFKADMVYEAFHIIRFIMKDR